MTESQTMAGPLNSSKCNPRYLIFGPFIWQIHKLNVIFFFYDAVANGPHSFCRLCWPYLFHVFRGKISRLILLTCKYAYLYVFLFSWPKEGGQLRIPTVGSVLNKHEQFSVDKWYGLQSSLRVCQARKQHFVQRPHRCAIVRTRIESHANANSWYYLLLFPRPTQHSRLCYQYIFCRYVHNFYRKRKKNCWRSLSFSEKTEKKSCEVDSIRCAMFPFLLRQILTTLCFLALKNKNKYLGTRCGVCVCVCVTSNELKYFPSKNKNEPFGADLFRECLLYAHKHVEDEQKLFGLAIFLVFHNFQYKRWTRTKET